MDFIYLIAGFALLLYAGDLLVSGAISLAKRFNIPNSTIGMTVIAMGTSAPELFTSLSAAGIKQSSNIAVGNVVGSNIFNLLAILGIASLLRPNPIGSEIKRIEWPSLMLATILFGLFALPDRLISNYEGVMFLGALVGYLIFALNRAKKVGRKEPSDKMDIFSPLKNTLLLAGGFVGLILGSELALTGGINLGTAFGLSERIIGITIISVGTGLPELATSAVAAFRGEEDIAISNVLGSNLFNTLAVTGATASLFPLSIDPRVASIDISTMFGVTLVLALFVYAGFKNLGRVFGSFFLMGYLAYISYLITNP